jgi:hypothetical protein
VLQGRKNAATRKSCVIIILGDELMKKDFITNLMEADDPDEQKVLLIVPPEHRSKSLGQKPSSKITFLDYIVAVLEYSPNNT